MKRRRLVGMIADRAGQLGVSWTLRRNGANHDLYDLDGTMIPIPRHRTIAPPTARDILKQTQPTLGERWWT